MNTADEYGVEIIAPSIFGVGRRLQREEISDKFWEHKYFPNTYWNWGRAVRVEESMKI